MPYLKIGTRGSPLALAQAREVRDRLMAAHDLAADEIAIVVITTTGDRIRDRPLAEGGGKGLFTKEIDEALIAGTIDLAVHSLKDLPARVPQGLVIASFLPREDARDAFLSPIASSLAELPRHATLGSSSVRRIAQALWLRPDLRTVPFRGNVGTRLRKLAGGLADATFLAAAGLNRLGLAEQVTSIVPIDVMLPAVAQGAIGIEVREGDEKFATLAAAINDRPTETAVRCERAFLAALDGSCRTPIAGHAWLEGGMLAFRGQALTLDGKHCFEAARHGPPSDAALLGRDAGEEVRDRGGSTIAGE